MINNINTTQVYIVPLMDIICILILMQLNNTQEYNEHDK